MNKHSRLYNELQAMAELRAWVRWHKVIGISAMIGIVLGTIIHLIK